MPIRGKGLASGTGFAKLTAPAACAILALFPILYLIEVNGAPAHYVIVASALMPIVVYVLIGLLSRTNDPAEYQLAGQRVPAVWSGMAAGAGTLPAFFVFGLTGTLFLMGYDGLAYVLGCMGGIALATVVIAPRLRQSGATNLPGYFGRRFGAPARALALAIVVISSITLLVAEIAFAGSLLARLLGVAYEWTILAGCVFILVCVLPGGMQGVTALQACQYLTLAGAYLAVLYFVAAKSHGLVLPQIAYGEALSEIAGLEKTLLERGLADARTLKPHGRPFLQLDALNFCALTFALMAGIASLPHVLTRFLTTRSVSDARFSGAWSLFFVFLLLFSAPACAAFAKLEVYTLISRGVEFSALPSWIETASRRDGLRIHGLSLEMLDDVMAARNAGAADIAGVSAHLMAGAGARLPAWLDLKAPVKSAVLDAAANLRDASHAERWNAFKKTVLPVGARADGSKSGLLRAGALTFDHENVIFTIPEMVSAPSVIAGLLIAGAIAAAMATANGLLITIGGALGDDARAMELGSTMLHSRGMTRVRIVVMLTGGLAALLALLWPPDPLAAMAAAVSLAAAGLFPALVLGLWWQRASGWGAVTGMLLGSGLAVAYFVGARYFPVDFYDTWSHLSNASESAARKFVSLKAAWAAASAGDAKAQAWAALEAHARGTPFKAGIANWFGVHGISAAVFGLPVGFLSAVLLSLAIPPRRPGTTSKPETKQVVPSTRD